jgi:succinoglycan biosynthesis protein ExoA
VVTRGGEGTGADGVVVFVPTLDEERFIERCLRSLLDADPLAAAAPLVVADGGSRDRTREIVRRMAEARPNIVLLDNPDRLQAAALNLALDPRFADRSVLIRCDAHAVYPERYVSRLVETLAARGADSVVVPMDAVAEGGCFQRAAAWIADTRIGAGGAAHRGGRRSGFVEHGHHAAFRLEAFRALGGYDPGFPTNEDAEYDARLIRRGGRIWLAAELRVGYFPRSTPLALWRQYRRYGEGRARTCLKHRARPRLRQLVPALNLPALAASAAAAPVEPLALAWPASYAALLGGAGVWTAIRRRSACGLLATIALGAAHLAWGAGFLLELARAARAAASSRLRRRRRGGSPLAGPGGAA